MIAGETRFVEIDAYLTALPADGGDGRNLVHLLDSVVQLGRQAAQLVIPVALAPERQREDGNVIDRARLDERRRSPRRDQVEVGEHFLVQAHDGPLFVLSDEEAHHGHGPAGAGSRIDVLDARDFPQ